MPPAIGVLALQGDVREHRVALDRLGVSYRPVRRPEELEGLDGLVIPGGESTTIGRLAERFGLLNPLRAALADGLPTLATCAGMILVAGAIVEGDQPLLGGLDVVVRRNAFGRQNESFEMDLDVKGLDRPFHGVFIRAPWVEKVGSEVEVLARVGDRPVMVRSGRIVALSFHPELTDDSRIHRLWMEGGGG
ncbi:MAG: pyridoxal 5'-phosphate synthase glutaminase subunit PdxT [bacterium]|nr:pyridoxal 5'-phosphate synthase glutaminase subunit PdxT [bacterium]MDE0601558.1 pyridoxal 5'-phosphate synthase glutaminase subunit PdxT [bacterium]